MPRPRRTKQVYTPQIVVDGHLTCIGSRRQEVAERIDTSLKRSEAAASLEVNVGNSSIDVVVMPQEGNAASRSARATLWLIPVRTTTTVAITRGENSGKTSS